MDHEQQYRMSANRYRDEAKIARNTVMKLEQQLAIDVNALIHNADQIDAGGGGEPGEAQSFREAAQRKSDELQAQITKAQSDVANYERMAQAEEQKADMARHGKDKVAERLRLAGRVFDWFS